MELQQTIHHAPFQGPSDLVKVVDQTAVIENLINQIIHLYVAPREHAAIFAWNVLLDTSVITLGAKLKVVMAVAQEVMFKLEKNSLHQLLSLRNAFAHNSTNAHLVLQIGEEGEPHSMYNELWILGSSGEHEILKRHEALEKFNKHYELSDSSLTLLLNVVKEQLTEHASYAAEKPNSKPFG